MSDEEEDYMSDKFLAQCEDKRPGLLTKEALRKTESEKARRKADSSSKTKSKKVLEEENREQGLQKSLDENNKGFALLAKMGYKAGQGIGKEGRKGRVDPVPVELKAGRHGLGHANERKRMRAQALTMRHELLKKRQRLHEQHQEDFRSRHHTAQKEKEFERDLTKSQRVCHNLDQRENVATPVQAFYWPQNIMDSIEASSASALCDVDDEEEALDDVILRQKGLKSDDRKVDQDEVVEEEEAILEDCNFTCQEKLQMVTSYLRETYKYCIWCGTQYDDDEDMAQNCPGDTAVDHDD